VIFQLIDPLIGLIPLHSPPFFPFHLPSEEGDRSGFDTSGLRELLVACACRRVAVLFVFGGGGGG
jgi:hypothetical protein